MKSIKKALDYIFIDGLSGMAMGLFATLIIGTILDQIAGFINHPIGAYMAACAAVAKSLTGASSIISSIKLPTIVEAFLCISVVTWV